MTWLMLDAWERSELLRGERERKKGDRCEYYDSYKFWSRENKEQNHVDGNHLIKFKVVQLSIISPTRQVGRQTNSTIHNTAQLLLKSPICIKSIDRSKNPPEPALPKYLPISYLPLQPANIAGPIPSHRRCPTQEGMTPPLVCFCLIQPRYPLFCK